MGAGHNRPCLGLNEKRRVTGGKRGQECRMYRKNITDNWEEDGVVVNFTAWAEEGRSPLWSVII